MALGPLLKQNIIWVPWSFHRWQIGVNICQRSETSPYLKASKLARHDLMDVGRRHETPGSETKDFITHSDSSSQDISICAISASPSFHKVMWISPRDTCTHTEWNPEFKDLKSLLGRKLIFPLSQREAWTCSQWAINQAVVGSRGRPSQSYKAVFYAYLLSRMVQNQGYGWLCL